MHLLFESERVFRIGTSDRLRGVYAITRLHLADTFAGGFNCATGVRSWRVRERGLQGIGTRAHVGVIRIDSDRMNANQHLAL